VVEGASLWVNGRVTASPVELDNLAGQRRHIKMQPYENAPLSPAKRFPISLNVDTGYKGKGKGRDVSPPRTPKAQSPQNINGHNPDANQTLRVRPGPGQTWLDDITPVDPSSLKENGRERTPEPRDSHDLSISPQQITRNSLVDHMLLSFDQLGYDHEEEIRPNVDDARLYSTFDEEPYEPSTNYSPTTNGRTGHNYSYSSDYENGDDLSRYSAHQARSRRSNSSSNFRPGLGRIHSVRNDSGANPPFSRGPTVQIPPRGMHSRSGKGSKGSSANSFDLGYTQAGNTQRWSRRLSRRSSSFDYGDRSGIHSSAVSRQAEIGAPGYGQYSPYDYDAAPTPTIHGGPTRARPSSPILISRPEPAAVESPRKLERKRSTRSSKSAYKGKPTSAARANYGLNDPGRDLPPLPAFIREPAPAPLVAYGKTKDTPQTPKDRPGFFRRVFGSSRNTSSPSSDPPASHGSSASADTTDRPSSKTHHAVNLTKPQHPQPPPPPKDTPHVLSKRPSSIFRRRKKSVTSDTPVPMVPPIHIQHKIDGQQGLPSPVSSLRQVMNPYLKGTAKSPLDSESSPKDVGHQTNEISDGNRTMRGFSPDYEPDKNATIRAVKPSSRDAQTSPSIYASGLKPPARPTRGFSKDSKAQSGDERGPTFLQDNSDVDPDSRSDISKPVPPTCSSQVTAQTAQSVTRDMALVAEYERLHSTRFPASAKSNLPKHSPVTESPGSTVESKRGQSRREGAAKDREVTSTKPLKPAEKGNRVWLEHSSEEELVGASTLELPSKATISSRASGSTDTVYKSATSLPMVNVDDQEDAGDVKRRTVESPRAPPETTSYATMTDEAHERARKIYDGNEDFVSKEKAAAWMGDKSPIRAKTLDAYMELYDFTNLNILAALRAVCNRLVLKGESQQVDRILDAFAKRWCQCNLNHGFKATGKLLILRFHPFYANRSLDVVHTICYSVLLLNTDLHLADIDQKMTRSQFVKNTMPTIRRIVAESAPDAFEPSRPSVLPSKTQAFSPDAQTTKFNENTLKPERSSIEIDRPSWRSSFKPPARADSDTLAGTIPTPLDYDSPIDDCGPLVKAPFHGTLRTWEVQVEIVLKDFYNSIRNERLPLFGAADETLPYQAPSLSTLSVFTNGMLRRTPSVLSKTPSETQFVRGRTADSMRPPNKWSSKNRSRPRLYPGSILGSSRTSLDDQSSMWSPSVASSTWSKYSLGKTQTSMSVDSVGSGWPHGDYQQSIGFANALSQAIIREETTIGSAGSDGSDDLRVVSLLEDESLELAGAPWAKEGIVKHKHHLEALDKKAKDRNWNEVFAVIEKGYMSLFSFSSKSMRSKTRSKTIGAVVGGGNWQDNAENLGSFLLRQTIASALPPPGYSKARPHVWALSLPTGAVHLFQVGTPDIVKEFVSTANYWSARLSNHPLVGGISNIEYGWSDAIVNNALVSAINESVLPSRPSTGGPRPSLQSSLRSSIDQNGYPRAKLPGDRITITDWTPPTQSMRTSNLMELDQLTTLLAYVASIEEELQEHNQLRSPMLLAVSSPSPLHICSC
jgi:hypothetical protein